MLVSAYEWAELDPILEYELDRIVVNGSNTLLFLTVNQWSELLTQNHTADSNY